MILAFVFAIVSTFAQGIIPPGQVINPTPRDQIQAPAPSTDSPAGPSTRSSSSGGSTTVVVQHATPAEIEADARIAGPAGSDATIRTWAGGTQLLARQSLGLPAWVFNRDKEQIFDSLNIRGVNDSLRIIGIGLFVLCFAMQLIKHIAGPFVGVEISGLMFSLPMTTFFGVIGWFNQPILDAIIDIVHIFLVAAADSPVTIAITPGLTTMQSPDPFTAAIGGAVALFYAIVALLLIVKIWMQVAWLIILGAAAPVYITITGAPFLGVFGDKWWKSWFGTLVDPILIIIALKVSAGFLLLISNGPQPGSQFFAALILLVMLGLPGWHSGAYGGRGADWVIGMMTAMAMRNLRGMGTGIGRTALPGAVTAAQATPQPPNYAHAISAANGGTGGGTAASWWKSRMWMPNP